MYSYSVDKVIKDLNQNGFSKLPSIRDLVIEKNYIEQFMKEEKHRTYKENSPTHLKIIEDMGLEKLFNALYLHGRELGLNIINDDKYFIARYVKNGQSSEGFRGHFDSHFITIVLPVLIPSNGIRLESGELLVVPKFRKIISNELINILQKAFFKRLNNKKSFKEFLTSGKGKLYDFLDQEPLIFYGNRTFHGNFPLSQCDSDRITFLCHLYDTSPPYGIGAFLRNLRKR